MMADPFRAASPAEGSRGSQNIAGNSYMPHWTTRVFDSTKLFSVQLLTLGGSGALAKTAVAPLERVKVRSDFDRALTLRIMHERIPACPHPIA